MSEKNMLMLKTLKAAGYDLSGNCLPLTSDSKQFDPSQLGYVAVPTGGGCMALRRNSGNFYTLITSEDGNDMPDMRDWSSNLIGVYRASDDAEIACATVMEWQQAISTESDR